MVSNSLLLLTWPKTPLSFVVKKRGKTPPCCTQTDMAKTSSFWSVPMSYFCAYLGYTRKTEGYCWRTPKSRKFYLIYGFFEPRGAWNIACRHVGLRIEMGWPTVSGGLWYLIMSPILISRKAIILRVRREPVTNRVPLVDKTVTSIKSIS
jgi:hypothetical protein